MRVFVTGASGFIGLALTKELIENGHRVLGLARSDASAKLIEDAGGEVLRGSLKDLESLTRGATACDAVVHLAFIHDFSDFANGCKTDAIAIETLGAALEGTNKPIIVTSGIGLFGVNREVTENDMPPQVSPRYPRASEHTAQALFERGINASVVRLPQVHDRSKQGLVTFLIAIAQQKGSAAYIGDGSNRYPAVHVDDCARLYRLALEKHRAGARYHAIAESGVLLKDITETFAKRLGIPAVSISEAEAAEYFGLMAMFAGMDSTASSDLTRKELDWQPTGQDLLSDLRELQIPELSSNH